MKYKLSLVIGDFKQSWSSLNLTKKLKLNHSAINENIKRFTKTYYVVLNYGKMNFDG